MSPQRHHQWMSRIARLDTIRNRAARITDFRTWFKAERIHGTAQRRFAAEFRHTVEEESW